MTPALPEGPAPIAASFWDSYCQVRLADPKGIEHAGKGADLPLSDSVCPGDISPPSSCFEYLVPDVVWSSRLESEKRGRCHQC